MQYQTSHSIKAWKTGYSSSKDMQNLEFVSPVFKFNLLLLQIPESQIIRNIVHLMVMISVCHGSPTSSQ